MTIRIVLVDDHPIFVDGLEASLSIEPSIEVVGSAFHGAEALHVIARHRPDVVLMDISMPGMNGIDVTRRIQHSHPKECRVILLTTHLDDEFIVSGLGAGAAGYLLKNGPIEHVVQAIHAVAAGGSVLHPSVAAKVIAEYTRFVAEQPAHGRQEGHALLTERELDILRLVANGHSNRLIADRLMITEATVKRHVSNILGKLDVADRDQAADLARLRGLV